jgi:hypothetical protein
MIYIFGGSFLAPGATDSWITRLSNNYDVCNLAKQNSANPNIFLTFLSTRDKMVKDDTVIIAWDDYMFPNVNNIDNIPARKRDTIMGTYLEYFFDSNLAKLHYDYYLNYVKDYAVANSINLIVLWAVPSNYITTDTWVSQGPWSYDYLKPDEFQYAVNFKNEIRPALMYFSKKELDGLTAKELEKYLMDDPRPNHIKDLTVHDKLYSTVSDFVDKRQTGCVNLL